MRCRIVPARPDFLSELQVFGALRNAGVDVVVEPSFGRLTPDFLVKDWAMVFEVASLQPEPDPDETAVVRELQKIRGTRKLHLRELSGLVPGKHPPLKKLRHAVERKMNSFSVEDLDAELNFELDGISIQGQVVQGEESWHTVLSMESSFGFSADDTDYLQRLWNVVENKRKKYTTVPGQGLKLIVVLVNYNSWVDEEEVEAFCRIYFSRLPDHGLSGILLVPQDRSRPYTVYADPAAKVALSEVEVTRLQGLHWP
jgi:hypothetical protein